MSERMSFKLQRLELREKRDLQEAQGKNTLSILRKILNPAVPLTTIREEDAMDTMAALAQQIIALRGIEAQIKVLNTELDG